MGIPSYFSYLVKNHKQIIKKFIKDEMKVDNLYLDCNSIIYDVYSKLDINKLTENIAINIINNVILKIEEYIFTVEPSNTVYIAFDGVAPVAKLEQQRNRRYKSWYQNEIARNIFQKENEDAWNTTSITPGTKFMNELNNRISKYFLTNNPNKYNINQVIVSGSNDIGEGEHKLFEYIRNNKEKHIDETTFIYGLDADLIMLSINHLPICPNIFLYRETPHFIKSIDSSLEPNDNYYLDIPEFSISIAKYMNNEEEINSKNLMNNRIYDYILLCFFMGNDFLPHFPALNIRTGGIDKIINAYKATIGGTNNYLTDGTTINWNNLRKIVQYIVNYEEEYIIKEHRTRNYKQKQLLPNNTPEEKFKNFELTPVYDRELEHYINPVKPNWQKRYYRCLFGMDKNEMNSKYEEKIGDIANNYLEGIEWTMKYYTTGCPNWRYKYRYNYPPLLQDLIRYIPVYDRELVPLTQPNPVSEIVQLCYVLPRAHLNLLPKKLCFKLLREHDEWYKGNCEFVWAYCRYFWESHVDMNEIDIYELEKFIDENNHLLS